MYSVVDFDPATLKGHCRVNSFPGTHVQLSDCVICHLGTSKKQLSISLETGQGQFRLVLQLCEYIVIRILLISCESFLNETL